MEDQVVEELIEQQPNEVQEQQEEQTQEEVQQKKSNVEHVRELRKKAAMAEQLRKERDEYYRMLQEAQQPKDQEVHRNPDDLVEWKDVQKEIKKIRDEVDAYKHQTTTSTAESRLKMQYPDFYQVVNDDTIEILKAEYPELAATLSSGSDLYSKAAATYTVIKKLNLAPDTQYASDRDRALQNAAKPKPLASVSPQHGESPLSRANAFAQGLTPELKSQLLKEMQEAKKRI